MYIYVVRAWFLAPTGALEEGMSCEDHPLLPADHPLFCDIIQMMLEGGAQEGC